MEGKIVVFYWFFLSVSKHTELTLLLKEFRRQQALGHSQTWQYLKNWRSHIDPAPGISLLLSSFYFYHLLEKLLSPVRVNLHSTSRCSSLVLGFLTTQVWSWCKSAICDCHITVQGLLTRRCASEAPRELAETAYWASALEFLIY